MTRYWTFAVTACLAFAQTPESPKGLTWGRASHDGELGIDIVSCHGLPRVDGASASCNPYEGDTSCSSALPVLCLKPENLPRPRYAVPAGGEYYAGWLGGHIGLTPPVRGDQLANRKAGDRLCEANLGPGYRMAEHHDGRVVQGMGLDRYYGKTWPSPDSALPGGGWAWYAYGDIPADSRFWVHIDDQRGNCWDKAAFMDDGTAQDPGDNLTRMKGVRISVSSVNGGRDQSNPFYGALNLTDGGEHRIDGLHYTTWLSDQDASHWIRVEFPKAVRVQAVMIELPLPASYPVREWALDVETETATGERRWTKLPSEPIRGFRGFFPLSQPLSRVTGVRVVFPGPSMIEVAELEIHGFAEATSPAAPVFK